MFCQELERLATSKQKNNFTWVKNDHIGFKVWYVFKGEVQSYYPDFIIKINDQKHVIFETKGVKDDQDEFKWKLKSGVLL